MSEHSDAKKQKKKQILLRNRHTQMVNAQAETHELGRVLEREREEEMREKALTSARAAERIAVRTLDQAAMEILRLAAPFEPFPEGLRADYDVLRFAYEWRFSEGAGQIRARTAAAW